LFTTGRTSAGLSEHFKKTALELQNLTVYSDEEVKRAQTLLLQLSNLDSQGLDRATKGAIGLASVFRMDLAGASELVAKWMTGNTDRLSKYGLHVKDTMTAEQKRNTIIDQLLVYYRRAEAETATYSGAIKQLGNTFDEVKETLGTAVTKNETFRKTIKYIKEELQYFIDSGQAEKWAENISKAVSGSVKAIETLWAIIKGGPWAAAAKGAEDLAGGMDEINKKARENVRTITEFRDNLKWIKPSIDDMRIVMEKGEAGWGEYRYKVAAADAEFEKNKKTIAGWMDKAFGLVGIQTEIAKAFDKSTKGVGIFGDKITTKLTETMITIPRDIYGRFLTANALAWVKAGTDAYEPWRIFGTKFEKSFAVMSITMKEGIVTEPRKLYDQFIKETNKAMLMAGLATKGWLKKIPDDIPFVDIQKKFDELLAKGVSVAKALEIIFKGLSDTVSTKWQEAVSKIEFIARSITGPLNDIGNQIQKNAEIALENEYTRRKKYIEATITNEEEKQAAFAKLDKEYDEKRRVMQRKAAKDAKAISVFEAIINTASAVTAALGAKPWGPWDYVFAATVAAMGAVKIALIASQPLPLAEGAVFAKPTEFWTGGGGHYMAGEAGPEAIVPLSDYTGKGRNRPIVIHNHFHVNGHEIKHEVKEIVETLSRRRELTIAGASVR